MVPLAERLPRQLEKEDVRRRDQRRFRQPWRADSGILRPECRVDSHAGKSRAHGALAAQSLKNSTIWHSKAGVRIGWPDQSIRTRATEHSARYGLTATAALRSCVPICTPGVSARPIPFRAFSASRCPTGKVGNSQEAHLAGSQTTVTSP